MDINAKQLEALDFNYLNQAETFQYSTDQLARAKSSTAIMDKLSAEVGDWEAATQAFDAAYRKATTTRQTKVVETLDSERDTIYAGFTGTVSNALKSPIATQQQAAQQLQEPIKRYAISTSAEYQEQTMRTEQLCTDLLANYAAPLADLGLTAWVEALQAKNCEFQEAMTQRTNEQAGYVKSELTNLRQQIIVAYRIFAKLMNVVLIYEGDSAYSAVIDQMNAEVRHYKQIAARKGASSSTSGTSGGTASAGTSPSTGGNAASDGANSTGDNGGQTGDNGGSSLPDDLGNDIPSGGSSSGADSGSTGANGGSGLPSDLGNG